MAKISLSHFIWSCALVEEVDNITGSLPLKVPNFHEYSISTMKNIIFKMYNYYKTYFLNICSFFILFYRFSAAFFLYGLLFDLQNLGSNMFLSQALLGAVDIPSKCLSYFVIKFLKRQPSTAFVLFSAGCCTLINIFVPKGENGGFQKKS